MNNQNQPNQLIRPDPRRPARCLRHRVWMAFCDDCRAAHTGPAGTPREDRSRVA